MKLIREISIYDRKTDDLLNSILLKLDVSVLIKIFDVNRQNDPDFLHIYKVTNKIYSDLIENGVDLMKYNFDDFEFYYDCFTE